jgi:nicotinamidase-related amidase
MDTGFRIEDRMTKALVIIDHQKGMFDIPGYPPFDGAGVTDRIADLIARARTANTPIYYVQHDGGTMDPFHPGKPGFPFVATIAPQPGDDVTIKTKSSAFHGTDFDTKLKRAGIDHLVITGMQSEYCVTSVIRGAYERGYKLTLVSDGHSTFDSEVAKAKDIAAIINDTTRGSFGEVVPAADIQFG